MPESARYAVFGNPIKHSKSPVIHAAFAEQCGEPVQYRAVRVPEDGFRRAATNFFAQGGAGLNVTLPFKAEAAGFADELGSLARRAGAVNTLTLRSDGTIKGDNTDGIGLIQDMVVNLGWSLPDRRLLILGAGGAVRGVLGPLLAERPRQVVVVNRTEARARELAQHFSDSGEVLGGGYDLLREGAFDIIINGTSAGLSGDMPDLPGSLLTERSCCYDMLYDAEPTPFMRWAALHTAWAVADGLGMLVEQAAQSFYIWRKVRPETRPVIQRVRRMMAGSETVHPAAR